MTEIDAETASKATLKIHQALKGYNNGQRVVLILSYLDCMMGHERRDLIWVWVRELIDAHEDDGIAWGDLLPGGEYFEEILRRTRAAANGEDKEPA